MNFKNLRTINQPKKFAKALKLLCLRNSINFTLLAAELDVHYRTVQKWKLGIHPVTKNNAVAICALFNITDIELSVLVEYPSTISEIAPRMCDIDLRETPQKRFVIYSSRHGRLKYVKKLDESNYIFTKVYKEATVFIEKVCNHFIKIADKRYVLKPQLLVDKHLTLDFKKI